MLRGTEEAMEEVAAGGFLAELLWAGSWFLAFFGGGALLSSSSGLPFLSFFERDRFLDFWALVCSPWFRTLSGFRSSFLVVTR